MSVIPNVYTDSTVRVCVDSVENRRMIGRAYFRKLENPLCYSDLGDLLLQVEQVLDRLNFPRAFQRKRTFKNVAMQPQIQNPPPCTLPEDVFETARGTASTFDIRIISRQNSSWQGELVWMDNSKTEPFESALELIRITDRRLFPKEA